MALSKQQLQQFDKEGYLFLPDLFSAEEIAVLRREAEAIFRTDRKEIWREKSGSPRTAFAAHTYNEAFRLLGAHPRLIRPVEQVFGEQLYMHQFKINAKSAFDGEVWQWHQDYGTWARDDGMPEPRAMNIAVFVDEVLPINGPLMLVPRSHKEGVLKAGHDMSTTSYPLWTLDNATVERLVQAGRHRHADRQAGRRADVPRQSGARLGRQHHAVSAQDRVPDVERGLQLHPHADASRLDRAPRFPSDRTGGGRCAAALCAGVSRRRGIIGTWDFRRSSSLTQANLDRRGRLACHGRET